MAWLLVYERHRLFKGVTYSLIQLVEAGLSSLVVSPDDRLVEMIELPESVHLGLLQARGTPQDLEPSLILHLCFAVCTCSNCSSWALTVMM